MKTEGLTSQLVDSRGTVTMLKARLLHLGQALRSIRLEQIMHSVQKLKGV